MPGYSLLLFDPSGIVGERQVGAANLASGEPITVATLFPVASLIKTWSAVVVLQLVAEGALRLDQPVVELLPEVRLPSTVQVRHLLSHSSHGSPGHSFHYDGRRFGLLGTLIEVASGEPFDQALQRRVIDRLGLRDTFLLGTSAESTPRHADIATPYQYEGSNTQCDLEYGHSASAGLVTTARDVARFELALLRGELLAPAQRSLLLQPYLPDGPTGLGSFVQPVDGRHIAWAYGQYDCFAALTVFDPVRGSGMVFLTNNNTPSDSARLLYGDVLTSPIALAWLGTPKGGVLDARAKLLRDAFFGRLHPERLESVIEDAGRFLDRFPSERHTPDLAGIHALISLKDMAWRMQQRQLTRFDAAVQAKAAAVLASDGSNPYAHYYLATLYALQGEHAQARVHYQAIVSAPNSARSWYTLEAEAALSGTAE